MAAAQTMIDAIDRLIEFFNKRTLDLPDGFFDRKTQFLINGATFESLLSNTPHDPLVLMLARGPAGYRFTLKALQHALPDARIERGELATSEEPSTITTTLWLSGKLRASAESIHSLIGVTMRLNAAGLVDTAAATIDSETLEKIRAARLKP